MKVFKSDVWHVTTMNFPIKIQSLFLFLPTFGWADMQGGLSIDIKLGACYFDLHWKGGTISGGCFSSRG